MCLKRLLLKSTQQLVREADNVFSVGATGEVLDIIGLSDYSFKAGHRHLLALLHFGLQFYLSLKDSQAAVHCSVAQNRQKARLQFIEWQWNIDYGLCCLPSLYRVSLDTVLDFPVKDGMADYMIDTSCPPGMLGCHCHPHSEEQCHLVNHNCHFLQHFFLQVSTWWSASWCLCE